MAAKIKIKEVGDNKVGKSLKWKDTYLFSFGGYKIVNV